MSILKDLSSSYRINSYGPASLENDIKELINFSQIEIPEDYLDLIREKTEIEINVGKEKYIRIWGANGCIEMNESYEIQENIPSSLAIADDEGGNALLYLNGNHGFGLYLIAFNNLDADELQFVSDSLSDLLSKEIGRNILKNC
ncbi:SMI1/KNR4 family protein [Sinanaerobacter sp. ZZT-01]|uniref:SMI1/KNR4 family protein n=1 Tax=Sinanaerobacter sp. ZZT-01 TaxID=3111540 RepID=UPI002D78522C|nr:SMI1/KNR4 family protein [Sinanaerobacter sp. ZZT-01]WRR93261.1 SMI1/KNR4 family protein [Sinanaerobacter sp. ZZT-01]